jgi:hypothetical protein
MGDKDKFILMRPRDASKQHCEARASLATSSTSLSRKRGRVPAEEAEMTISEASARLAQKSGLAPLSLCIDSPRILVSVGHGPQARLWVLERLQQTPPPDFRGMSADAVVSPIELFVLAWSFWWSDCRSRAARAKIFHRAQWYPFGYSCYRPR